MSDNRQGRGRKNRSDDRVNHALFEALKPFRGRFGWAFLYFNVLILFGTLGYRLIEGWPLRDCLYMAAITTTSVGFMEVHDLSETGRVFTMVLIAGGIVGLGFWWALTTALIVEADLGGLLRRRRMLGKLDRLQDHFIICGGGRMGRVVAEEMKHSNQPFVVVDRIQDRLKLIEEAHGEVCTIEGDATKEHTLETARIDTARGLACCLSDDGDNLLLCLTARGLRPELSIVARANDQESLEKLRRAGANHAISPNYTGAVRVAAALLRPSIVSFLDSATSGAGISLRLEQATVPEHSELVGQSLADVRIPQRTGLVVLALRRHNDGPQIYNPGPETKLEGNDEVIVLGGPEQIEKLRTYFGH